MSEKNYPDKYTIPKERIPKPWNQGIYDCCVAASITKVLEVINYVKTGTYTMLSKGYTYGRHNKSEKKQGGMDFEYTISRLLEKGTVTEEQYPHMNEMPNIMDDLEKCPNILDLDKEAEKTKIQSFTKFKGDIYFYDNVKKCLYEHNMPLVGSMVGKRHSVVIVGWDGNKLLYHDHKGSDKLYKGKFNEAYYLDGGINSENVLDKDGGDIMDKALPFIDVKKDDWFYQGVEYVYMNGFMNGKTENKFDPNASLTRAEFATVIQRLMEKEGDKI